MANTIRLKRASGSDPGASDLVTGELAVRTDTGKLFTKKDDNSIAEISGGGIDDGDKGDITVSNSGATFTIDNDVVSTAKMANMATQRILGRQASGTGDPQHLTATEARSILNVENGATADQSASEIKTLLNSDGIVNANVDASAAIAGSKISPSFTSDVTITGGQPALSFIDDGANPDYKLYNNNGTLRLYDITNAADRLVVNTDGHVDITGNLDVGAGVDVTGEITATSHLDMPDDAKIKLGTGDDLQIYHDGSINHIKSGNASTNDLKITNTGNFIVETSDSENLIRGIKNGATELYYDGSKKLETTSAGVEVTGNIVQSSGSYIDMGAGDLYTDDNGKIRLGTSSDLQLYHSGTNSVIDNNTGGLYIRNNVAADVGGDIFIQAKSGENSAIFTHDGSAALHYNNVKKFETTSTGATVTGALGVDGLYIGDSNKLNLGTGNDLQIYHDGSNSVIKNKTGSLYLNATDSDIAVKIIPDAAVELYHDNSKKLETTSAGVDVIDDLTIDATGYAGLNFETDRTSATDNIGGPIFKNASGTVVSKIQSLVNGTINIIAHANNEKMITAIPDGVVELYYDNTKRLETKSDGARFTGHLYANDNEKIRLGTGHDLEIYHSSGDSHITNSDGNLNIVNSTDGWIRLQPKSGEEGIIVKADGATELYYDHSKKLETTSAGATVTGDVSISSATPILNFIETNANPDYRLLTDGGEFVIQNDQSGSFATKFKINSTGNLQIPNDSGKLQLGASQDLQIYHDGSNSFLKDTNDYLFISGNNGVVIKTNSAGTEENQIRCINNGAVELYYDNVKQIQTTADGVGFVNNCTFSDSKKIQMGAGNDLQIYHGSDSNIIDSTGKNFFILHNSDSAITSLANGAVELYHDNSLRLATDANGIHVTTNVHMNDNGVLELGTGSDLQLFHDGTNSILQNNTGVFYLKTINGEFSLVARPNGATELYYDHSKKFETVTGGATITGVCTATSFAGDGSSLTGISAGATGGGSDEVFYENSQTVTTNYTITNGKNAMSAGPITINSGVTVTVGSGETLTIV